ncbi:MAG: hypothetical protein KTR25_06865 [Myxococcales bacterium]|nr:hypothetical protein [Myxococcales bacterium]
MKLIQRLTIFTKASIIASTLFAGQSVMANDDLTIASERWRYGGYGVNVKCGTNEIGLGLCGSGENADCSRNYTGLQCGNIVGGAVNSPGYLVGADYGVRLSCPFATVATSLCSSGKNRDCKVNNISHTIGLTCSQPSGITVNRNACFWQSSPYGKKTSCPSGFVMTGACGSGKNKDCRSVHSELECCSYDVN